MSYGVPYVGSKSAIADKIIAMLPPASVFVDLFAGGCAMTHAALLSGKYGRVIANDIEGSGIRLFVDAAQGKYRNEKRWISRNMFHALKDSDPYVKLCWSFAGKGEAYMYSRSLEPFKRAVFEMIFDDNPYARKLRFRSVLIALSQVTQNFHEKTMIQMACIDRLQRLQNIEMLNRVQGIEGLSIADRLQTSFVDYRDVDIPDSALIYADIPYRDAEKGIYGVNFDFEAFYRWARGKKNLVISEYSMPEGFVCAAEIDHVSPLAGRGNKHCVERLFVPVGGMALTKQLALEG